MSEQATVYLLTKGEYSDYGVVAAYSTKEKADTALAEFNRDRSEYSLGRIEERPLDSYRAETAYYLVGVNRDGTMKYVSRTTRDNDNSEPLHTYDSPRYSRDGVLCLYVYVDTREAAIKVAGEKWAKINSAGLWGNNEALATV